MKRIINKAVLSVTLVLMLNLVLKAQPTWTVNPNDYVYSMTITGKINTDGYLSDDTNDMIAAFIDNECRGVVHVKKTQLNDYFVFLMVYSNSPVGTVSFKIYDASEDKEFTVKQTINFTVNDIIGSVSNPFIFSASALSNEAKILSFTIPDQQGQTFFNGNQISLQTIWSGNLTAIAPAFTVSAGAKVTVNGVEQVSGVSVNNFTQKVDYVVESADLSQTTLYTVSVTLANDIPTDLQLSNTEVDENTPGAIIGTLKAISENTSKKWYYTLLDIPGIDNSNFYIEGDKLNYLDPFNYENGAAHKIYVQADDKKGGIIKRYFLININNKNDAPGAPGIKGVSLSDNMPANHVTGELYAIDEDAGDTQKFELVSGNGNNDRDNSLFYLDGKWLKTLGILNYSKGYEYSILVKVTDSQGASSIARIVFGLEDQGVAPYNIILSNSVVSDISNPPVFVGKFQALDVDQVVNHIFKLEDDTVTGADNGYFELKGDSLFLSTPLPETEKTDYLINISATDSTNRNFVKAFIIKVTKNQQTESFYLSRNSIPENVAFNSIVGFFDSQTYQVNDYSFSLPLEVDLSKFSNQDFKLVGRTLLTNRIFDYEEQKSATIRLMVTNGNTSTFQNVSVNITDENDTPSRIILSNTIFSESAAISTVLGEFTADDQDAGDTHIFSLVLGNGINDESNNMFKIEGNKLLLAKPLDYETSEFHNILVRVVDNRGASFEQGLRLQVADANDAPVFNSQPLNFVLQDEVYVYPVSVTDSENDSIFFRFEELPAWLSFDQQSGVLSGIPGNEEVGVHTFKIVASDGNKERNQQVVLNVINVNDPPEINYFLGKQYFVCNTENELELPAGLFVDPDTGDELKYTVSSENNSALPDWLIFDQKTMKLSGNPPSEAQGKYSLKITATDRGKLKEWMIFDLVVTFATDVTEMDENDGFRFYPNPVTDQLNIVIPAGKEMAQILITNQSGQLVRSFEFNPGGNEKVQLQNLSPGVYLVTCKMDKLVSLKKLIKQ